MSESGDHQDDLDLLLSLQDRVPETPPASPSGYLSDDGRSKHTGPVDMSVFRDVVQECLDIDSKTAVQSHKFTKQVKSSKEIEVEKFSGLRIQNSVVSRLELSNYLADIRFVRLPAIKNSLIGDTLSGCWATVGILTEKGLRRTSSIGKPFAIWKFGCLDDNNISVFLFGDAYLKNADEKIGTVFALFNCSVRKDNAGKGFSLSVFAGKHILKLGTSPDIGVCQGKGKDGVSCTTAIDKRRRKYCNYHKQNASQQYTSKRTELRGGNLKTGFKDYLKSEGIYVVKPMDDRANMTKSTKPLKLLSVDGLKKALRTADKVTTNAHSQGIRFLSHVTGNVGLKSTKGAVASLPQQKKNKTDNRLPRSGSSHEPDAKKMKTDQRQAPPKENKHVGVKMIELDFASSDEEL